MKCVAASVVTDRLDRETDTQIDYHNPCACALKINDIKYRLDTEAKGSTGFGILKTLI